MTHREAAEDLAEFERTGGPAFPWDGLGDDGMTLRDYFASKAMQVVMQSFYEEGLYPGDGGNAVSIASIAYKQADAMLEARK